METYSAVCSFRKYRKGRVLKRVPDEIRKAILSEPGLGTGYMNGWKNMAGYVVWGEIKGCTGQQIKRRQEVSNKYGVSLTYIGRIVREEYEQ